MSKVFKYKLGELVKFNNPLIGHFGIVVAFSEKETHVSYMIGLLKIKNGILKPITYRSLKESFDCNIYTVIKKEDYKRTVINLFPLEDVAIKSCTYKDLLLLELDYK